jgi:hypothetical protein
MSYRLSNEKFNEAHIVFFKKKKKKKKKVRKKLNCPSNGVNIMLYLILEFKTINNELPQFASFCSKPINRLFDMKK